ncbi:uncharacterized protein LOC131319390 [Rhododendron vialii]|uniref:uncharacterized protein LOC131319390 n=1 Tax=Rhododendron vialii TaxID=182163 RepID=UPI00265E6D18|nr:uncharacterized protein LOC131319390 [Rhododendron vialii]
MASTSSKDPPPSSPSETPTVNISTKAKSKSCSIRNLVANFKAKFFVSKPKPLDYNHHNAASSSTATTIKNDYDSGALSLSSKMIRNHLLLVDSAFGEAKKYMDHGGALFLSSNMIRNNLLLVDSAAFAEAKKYMDHLNVKINKAHEKFEELQTLGGSLRDFDELQKEVAKMRLQISSHVKIRHANSNPHRKRWPNINEAEDRMSHFFYKEPEDTHTGDFDGLLEAFHVLFLRWRHCLLCFFKFPPAAIIKRTTMIYLWAGLGYTSVLIEDDRYDSNMIFDELVEQRSEPAYSQESYRMSISVRSALYEAAKARGFTLNHNRDLDLENDTGLRLGHTCLVNVGEAIISWEPKIFDNIKHIRCFYLGRWQSSATHHIELADAKILHGLKDLKSLTFLSLRGISMITELPASILELKNLAILDLQACHNLEAIPEDISLLRRLTQLDMSECYFLEHMPKSLAQLTNLEVLKGFIIGDFKNNKQSCTLQDLSILLKLRKLSIYVSVKDFSRLWDFDDLKNFEHLLKLTISWGGCSLHGERSKQSQEEARMELFRPPVSLTLPPILQKLDLRCFPTANLTN